MPLPDARATDDIDSFLALEIFTRNEVERFRSVLDGLGYTATEKGKYLQFTKPASVGDLKLAKFDLHGRLPEEVKQRTTGKLISL